MTATSWDAFDAEHAYAFLKLMHLNKIGWTSVVSTNNWTGQQYLTDELGLQNAVEYAERIDRAADRTKPFGVYYRVSTLREPLKPGKRGEEKDTAIVPAFWADLDYGTDGHKRRDKQLPLPPTEDDARGLVAEAGLPEPTLWIHSGGGLYPLWLVGDIQPDIAKPISEGIQDAILAASVERGWHYGSGVGDIARVLRLPGSVNRKLPYTPRPCRVISGGTGKPVALDQLPVRDPSKPRVTAPGVRSNELPPRKEYTPTQGRTGVFDTLADACTWADILEPAGWEYIGHRGGAELWNRPGGGDSEYSAKVLDVNPHVLVVHSENADLPVGGGQRNTKGRVYAHLWHGGDVSAAARELVKREGRLSPEGAAAFDRAMTKNEWFGLEPTTIQVRPVDQPQTPNDPFNYPDAATDEEMSYFLATYTDFRRPERLGRRTNWMRNDRAARLPIHARRMVDDVLAGHYPARKALDVLKVACQHHGGSNPSAPLQILSVALGSALADRMKASA